ncbi:MAG TPA: AMP-binding protein [Acidimicrobiales bacterium]|nr:AMP-binding protein [Acidimicrobiales bacterium]
MLAFQHAFADRLVYRKLRAALGGRVSYCISGGGALDPSVAHVLRGAGITILEGYGLTETSAPVTLNAPPANQIGTVGRPLPGVDIRVAPGGEVLVRGANVFRGYWHDDDATRAAFDAEGWFHTGDLGMLDADALDRFAAAHGLAGRSAADLIDEPTVRSAVQDAIASANQTVSPVESIHRFRILPRGFSEDADELTPTLKLKRGVIAAHFRAEIDALYDDHQSDLDDVLRDGR